MRLSSGTARLALVKWASCARPDSDVDSATGLCRGFCELGWLATRGEYSGTLYNRRDPNPNPNPTPSPDQAHNVFFYLTYEGAVDLESPTLDAAEALALKTQVRVS